MNGREVLLEVEPVEALHEASGSEMVPPENPHVRHKHYEGGENNARDETQVGDAALATDEPLLLREDALQDAEDRKSTRLNSSHSGETRMPSSA